MQPSSRPSFFRRRRFLINKRLQGRLLLSTLCYGALGIALVAVVLFAPLMRRLLQESPESPASILEDAERILHLHESYWVGALFALVLVVLMSIRTSHKIAGPLKRFEAVFEAVRRGEIPPPQRLRKGDYLLREMDHINAMTSALRKRNQMIESETERLRIVAEEGRATCVAHGDRDGEVWVESILAQEAAVHRAVFDEQPGIQEEVPAHAPIG